MNMMVYIHQPQEMYPHKPPFTGNNQGTIFLLSAYFSLYFKLTTILIITLFTDSITHVCCPTITVLCCPPITALCCPPITSLLSNNHNPLLWCRATALCCPTITALCFPVFSTIHHCLWCRATDFARIRAADSTRIHATSVN